MKNQIRNKNTERIRLMSILNKLIGQGHKTFLILAAAFFAMGTVTDHTMAANLTANNVASFISAVDEARTNSDSENTITLTGNVDFTAPYLMNVGGKKVILDLSQYNLMGTQALEVTGGAGAELTTQVIRPA